MNKNYKYLAIGIMVGALLACLFAFLLTRTAQASQRHKECEEHCVTPSPTQLPDFCPDEEGYQPYGPCIPVVTETPEVTPSPEITYPPVHQDGSDNLGCSVKDCSGNKVGGDATPQPIITLAPCTPGVCGYK